MVSNKKKSITEIGSRRKGVADLPYFRRGNKIFLCYNIARRYRLPDSWPMQFSARSANSFLANLIDLELKLLYVIAGIVAITSTGLWKERRVGGPEPWCQVGDDRRRGRGRETVSFLLLSFFLFFSYCLPWLWNVRDKWLRTCVCANLEERLAYSDRRGGCHVAGPMATTAFYLYF